MADKICPHAEECGGCAYAAVPYEEQLATKQKLVDKLLSPFAKVSPIIRAEQPLYYRNKAHRVLSVGRNGRISSGIYAEGTHRVIPVRECRIEDRTCQLILTDLAALVQDFRLPVYHEDRRTGLIRHFLVRRGAATGEVMAVIVTASAVFPSRKNFVKALLELHPEITTVIQNVNSRKTNMVLGDRDIVLYGKGWIEDRLCGHTFRISPNSFYQVNPAQTEILYNTAVRMAGLTGRETVIDAYCGIGTIGICAAPYAKEVTGIELNENAVKDARQNAARNWLTNIRFAAGDAGEWMVRQAADGAHADVVFLDPPRAGTTPEFVQACAALAPERIVYISCNPETLARDLALYQQIGYQAKEIQPVEMFAFTGHVETVCALSKLSEAKHHISVQVDMDELDVTAAESKATYEEIQAWVKEKYGFHVTHLNIAKTKRKCGIIERQNYNLPKSENSRSPEMPKQKKEAIIEAFRHFQMI